MKGKKVLLVIAAHPDDEVLGCGATVAKYVDLGFAANILILGEGVTSRYQDREKADFSKVKSLQREAQLAAKVLGVKRLFLENLPDNRFDSVPLLDIIKKIEKIKNIIKPDIVFTHHGLDLNIDHQITCRATVTAFRPCRGNTQHIYGFEIPDFKGWGAFRGSAFIPDYFVDVHGYLDKKLQALKFYASELKKYPHPRSLKIVKSLAEYRGSFCARKQAEAFNTLLSIN